MALTYTVSDALSFCAKVLPRAIEDDAAHLLANIAINEMWTKYDWRETLAELPPFWVIPNEQDYGAPYYGVPADFLGLRKAYLVQTSATPPYRLELDVIKDLRETYGRAMPQAIGYVPEFNKFRLFPQPPESLTSTDWLVDGVYKKRPVKVTPSTLQSTLIPWDDLHFSVFCAGLKWAGLDAVGDPRAEKQRATFDALLTEMASNEGLELGDPIIAPAAPLAVTSRGGYMPGLLGF